MGTQNKLKFLLPVFLLFLVFSSFVLAADPVVYTDQQPAQDFEPTTGSCTELCANDPNCNCGQDTCGCQDGEHTCVDGVTTDKVVTITFFYSETCPHCHEAMEFFDALEKTRPNFVLEKYEVVHNESSRIYAQEFCADQGVPFQSVPTYFIGDQYFVGYSSSMNEEIITAIDHALLGMKATNSSTVKLPIIGEVDPAAISLPVLAVMLGFIDGFNPCAFFVLLFLLSMLVYAKSRSRMLLIGLTFVFFSALIYFLFMSAWLNIFLVSSGIAVITTIAGVIALIIAALNIKDFFAFKKGVSLSISQKQRGSLMKRMRGLLKAESLVSMLIGTIVLAVTANLYELLCTLGLPMVFTSALTLNELPKLTYYLYLLLYNIVYVLPLLVIVLVFTFTLGSRKLSQNQGESLKLLSGMMMLAFGFMLVFKPEWLQNSIAAVGLLLLAVALTAIIIFVKRFLKRRRDQKPENGARPVKKED